MINVVIADDSALVRQVLTDVLEKDGKIKVVAAAKNGKEAVAVIKAIKPDLAIFDIEMPVMNGLEALRIVMKETPLPVLMFSSLTSEGASVTINALASGAVDFCLKPTSESEGIQNIAKTLIRKIEIIAIRGKFLKLGAGKAATASTPKKKLNKSLLPKKKIDLIVVGSSTGGVQAAMHLFPKLPEKFPPILWVQHMPVTFTEKLAQRLDGASKMKVKQAENGEIIKKGVCYLAPGDIHMNLSKTMSQASIRLEGTEKISGFCPSCDNMFSSVAQLIKNSSNVLGVILTGMGEDGSKGLKQLHDQGAYVLGQDEGSCVVYGMPKVAFNVGAVDTEVDIMEIAEAIKYVCGSE